MSEKWCPTCEGTDIIIMGDLRLCCLTCNGSGKNPNKFIISKEEGESEIRIHNNPNHCLHVDMKNTGYSIKDVRGKLRWSLMPMEALEEVMKVIEFGTKKYKPNSWQNNTVHECYDALFRHLVGFENKYHDDEEPIDEESKLHHMAHIATNALFILYLYKKDKKEKEQWQEAREKSIKEETPKNSTSVKE